MADEKKNRLTGIPDSCGFTEKVVPDDSRCPVTRYRTDFGPSRLLDEARTGVFPEGIRHCLGCELCSLWPDSRFPACADAIISAGGKKDGYTPRAFGGSLDSVVTLQIKDSENQKRLKWITPDIQVSEKAGGDGVALFVGCSPYYDALLADKIGFSPSSEARGAVELLNAVGVRPVVLPGEVCCGCDRLHAGDIESFTGLGKRNRDLLKERGVGTIVTTCDDCRFTLSCRYPGRIPDWDFKIIRLTDYLTRFDGRLVFMPTKGTVVIQPPDRYTDPDESGSVKKLLSRVPGLEIMEMDPGHPSTFGGWDQFDNVSRQMETSFIRDGEKTGAKKLLIPGTRVLVRLLEGRRPGSWEETSIEITGLYTFLAGRHAVSADFAGA